MLTELLGILKNDVLKDWYAIYPERFQNKTNGITQRRWLALCNPELSDLLTELLGDESWKTDLSQLKKLEKFVEDDAVMERVAEIKMHNHQRLAAYIRKKDGIEVDPNTCFDIQIKRLHEYKRQVMERVAEIKMHNHQRLAAYIRKKDGIEVDPNTCFDIQIKRLHEYKRQFLNILAILELYYEIKEGSLTDFTPTTFIFGAKSADIQIKRLHEYKRQFLNILAILELYYEIKEGSLTDFTPTTFIFGAKSAPGYTRAKGIIKLINEVARLIDNDPQVRGILKVVFVSNYNVSYAEKLVAAADISEQISTAGKEASGTGNMKLMANGAVTMGTYDGANIEIFEEAGEENNYRFGATVDEIRDVAERYNPNWTYNNDRRVKRILGALVDGTLNDGGSGIFRELHDSIVYGAGQRPDQYFLLLDLDRYLEARKQASRDYKDRIGFARKCWMNICNSGKFSSDRTIAEYADEIWHIEGALVDGTLNDGGSGIFRELHDSIVYGAGQRPDQYFLLLDLDRYLEARKQASRDYKDRIGFARKCWMNICNSGKFSSDRTIAEYADEIWHIEKI